MPTSAASKSQLPTARDIVRSVSAELDRLLRDMELGHPSQREFERQADIAHNLAGRLRGAFRAPPTPVNPPLYVSPEGDRAAW